jgi:hypothetical protein
MYCRYYFMEKNKHPDVENRTLLQKSQNPKNKISKVISCI